MQGLVGQFYLKYIKLKGVRWAFYARLVVAFSFKCIKASWALLNLTHKVALSWIYCPMLQGHVMALEQELCLSPLGHPVISLNGTFTHTA